ncbi:outer membrane protein assembly factor BamB family protein [Zavarzinella formosa]|uniref:outer membrane protein assembly factor BamB family protein n=1 Tax=Zavarzinella formosa TaxID=360055 RepID=UPI0003000FFA|nr:PQQ-binding-like beta-propeller repeat protein [Zavarzinella formosa]
MNKLSRWGLAGLAGATLGVGAAVYFGGAKPNLIGEVRADEPKTAAQTTTPAAKKGDHTMFGGTPDHNFVNLVATDISATFDKSEEDEKVSVLGKRIKWKQPLGSRAYGGPTIAGGKIFVGTNNENPRNKRDRGKPTDDDPNGPPIDKGVIMCFEEATGNFLWQFVNDKLESGQVNDWPREGICSTPTVEGNRVYFATNRCEIVCADVDGMANGNDGVTNEKHKEKTDADIIWSLDMIKDLKVFPHNMTASSPLIIGDLLLIVTANGVDENHINIPFPEAPSFLALNKNTGKVVWKSNLPGKAIMHGQWSNCSVGTIKGKPQAIFPGGDGWLYSLELETGKVLWKFDANPKDSKYELGGKGTRSDFIGSPVIHEDKVYIGTGQDPEHFEGIGHFYCIDASKQGDVSPDLVTDAAKDPPETKPNPNSAVVWHYGGEEKRPFAKRDYAYGRTMSTACIIDGVLYISELAGYLHCLDAKTGKKFWQFDTKSAIWGSPYYVDGKILLANEDGDVYFFKHEKEQTVLDEVAEGSAAGVAAEKKAGIDGKDSADAKKAGRDANDEAIKAMKDKVKAKFLLTKVEIGEAVRSTPVVANGQLYIMSEKTLFAVNPK